jgi:FlaA1/EpsC-like NDP-sugar epimerase
MLHRINPRSLVAIAHDLIWAGFVWLLAVVVRYGITDFSQLPRSAFEVLPAVLAIQLGCNLAFGLYLGMWRYASWHDLRRIFVTVLVSSSAIFLLVSIWRPNSGIPRSLLLLYPCLLIFFMAGGRIAYRWWKTELPVRGERTEAEPVVLLSEGELSLSLLYEIQRSPNFKLLGILTRDAVNVGRSIAGVPVVGLWGELGLVAQRMGVKRAVLSDRGLDHDSRRYAFQLCENAHLKLMLLPDVDDLMSGRLRYSELREVELDDLLGRDPVKLDTKGLAQLISDRIVLVTGAGGSIGSELCRQIARFNPGLIVMFELNEYALYQVEEEFSRRFPSVPITCVVGDVKDQRRVEEIFERYRPAVVFHAAAYKHVPLMESENAWEAVRNNTLGTRMLMGAIEQYPVDKLVFISTDKAVNPTSVMGASKRVAEMLLQRWNHRVDTHTVIVRFGNVLGSTGSVVPKFKQQIAAGGPVTVTHPEMRRYFMSVSEATQLVLQAALMGEGGEIFVLDMGKPVKIVDLAKDMIRLSGKTEAEIAIEFTGLRAGEKLYEELIASDESTLATRHPKLRIAKVDNLASAEWERRAVSWLASNDSHTPNDVKARLRMLINEYQPNGESTSGKVVRLKPNSIRV